MTEHTFYFDNFTKLHNSLYIKGWAHADTKPEFQRPIVRASGIIGYTFKKIDDMPWLGSLEATSTGFEIQILRDADTSPEDIEITFEEPDAPITLTWDKIQQRISEQSPQWSVWNRFLDIMKSGTVHNLLDIGGRARSGIFRAGGFPEMNVDVLDILPDEGVNYVGDAHRASQIITDKKYDAIMSTSVFEHLIMPWKAAVEINRLLVPGGHAFIHTHQSIGMHDLPWDYFRFSDMAWKGIFNRGTGFEIIDAAMQDMMYILPCHWAPRHTEVENARGFETSAVLVRKIGESQVDWDLGAADVTEDMYPE